MNDPEKDDEDPPFRWNGRSKVRLSTKDGLPANRAQRRAWAKRNGVPPNKVVRPT